MSRRVGDGSTPDGMLSIRRPSSGTLPSLLATLPNILLFLSFPCFVLIARFFPFEKLPAMCVFRLVTGCPCPTCGLTRSVVALMYLDFVKAVHMNPFGFLAVGGFAGWWVVSLYEKAAGHTTNLRRWVVRHALCLALLCIAALGLFGVLRIAWLINH